MVFNMKFVHIVQMMINGCCSVKDLKMDIIEKKTNGNNLVRAKDNTLLYRKVITTPFRNCLVLSISPLYPNFCSSGNKLMIKKYVHCFPFC